MEHVVQMSAFDTQTSELKKNPRTWLVTGAAGFIGSHLVEHLLKFSQKVIALDNFITGSLQNLDAVRAIVGEDLWRNFSFHQVDIRDSAAVSKVFTAGAIDIVLHQAALGSVPRSMAEPLVTFGANVDGFANVLEAARLAKVRRFVYASSSSVYGDDTSDIKTEDVTGVVLSPYAASKAINEEWAASYAKAYDMECVGLRYFNVFGPRQDPNGPYAAVVAKWIDGVAAGTQCVVHGDGSTSRDFCFVENVVQANILAGTRELPTKPSVFNIACGTTTTLLQLWDGIQDAVSVVLQKERASKTLAFEPFRPGDIRHSLANIDRASRVLGYSATHSVKDGLVETARWALTQKQ